MKKIIALLTLSAALSVSAFAGEEAKVVITSFAPTGQASRVAELCGKVTNSGAAINYVRAVADPSHNPGVYNTVVGKDGDFCMTVTTFYGRVNVSLWDPTKAEASSRSTEATISYTDFRN